MARPVMFLRTAQTEQRITDLEEKMSQVLTKLGMVPPSLSDEEWEAAKPTVEDKIKEITPEPRNEAERSARQFVKGKRKA